MLLKEEIEKTVASAIEELPDDLKTAITLRELEGLSYEEIAQAMECPIGTVRSRIFRARDTVITSYSIHYTKLYEYHGYLYWPPGQAAGIS